MKKIFYLAIFFVINLNAAENKLEDAIRDTDLQEVERLLPLRKSYTQEEKFICLNLADQKIQQINSNIIFDKIDPRMHSFSGAVSVIGLISFPIACMIYFDGYHYQRDGLKPLAVTSFAFLAITTCLIKGLLNEIKYDEEIKQKHRDAIKIQHLLLQFFSHYL